ncbi:MAG: hypothetical protein U0X73_07910 [Thermoanaerobaculia bacterium]
MKILDRWLSAAALLASTLGVGAPLHAQNCPKPWECEAWPKACSRSEFVEVLEAIANGISTGGGYTPRAERGKRHRDAGSLRARLSSHGSEVDGR